MRRTHDVVLFADKALAADVRPLLRGAIDHGRPASEGANAPGLVLDAGKLAQLASAAALAVVLTCTAAGCSDENADVLATSLPQMCCEDFKVGADLTAVDFGIRAEADARLYGTFLQASADLAALAASITDELSLSCQAIAIDLGAKEDSVQETDPNKKVSAWCNAASNNLEAVVAAARRSVSFSPPRCTVSPLDTVRCLAGCSGQPGCVVEESSVEGSCEGGEMSFTCEGGCKGWCEGSATLAVACSGSCEGTCLGACDGMQLAAAGSRCAGACQGACEGACSADGTALCEGGCRGECTGTASAMRCSGRYVPAGGMCDVSAECRGSCDASAAARGGCAPPSVAVDAASTADPALVARLGGTLEANLPAVLIADKARGQALVDIGKSVISVGVTMTDRAPEFSPKAGLCVKPAVSALAIAGASFETALGAAKGVLSKVGG